MRTKTKAFDCVEMKRQGAESLRQRLGRMTPAQEIEYWRERSNQFQREQDRLRSGTPVMTAGKRRAGAPVSATKVKALKAMARRVDVEEQSEIKALGRRVFRRH